MSTVLCSEDFAKSNISYFISISISRAVWGKQFRNPPTQEVVIYVCTVVLILAKPEPDSQIRNWFSILIANQLNIFYEYSVTISECEMP